MSKKRKRSQRPQPGPTAGKPASPKGEASAKASTKADTKADTKAAAPAAAPAAAEAELDAKAAAASAEPSPSSAAQPLPEARVTADKVGPGARGTRGKRGKPDEPPPEARASLPRPARLPPPPAPVFWFGFELPWAKLVAARVVLFGLLAIDAFLQIRHAPRYGAGDFNVAHFSFLNSLGPGRVGYGVGQLVETYLFALAALGVGTRLVLPIAAALYAWLYFGSQLDSYQHHYLMALAVAIACFVPWQRPADATPATPVRSWALRLLLVQLGIMYLWAAISKMDSAWTSGQTLGGQLAGSLRSLVDATIGLRRASILVIGTELVLAATIWLRPAWRIAAPLGLAFHVGIVASGLEIGLFAYLMLGLYLLVLPDAWLVRLAEARVLQPIRRVLHRLGAATSWALWALALAAGLGLAALVRVEHAFAAALAVSAIPIGLAVRARIAGGGPPTTLGAAHLLALALWLVADRASSVAVDYYKFWAGSQRRLGDMKTAEQAYRRLVEVAPDLELGHYYLGRILIAGGRGEEGARHLHDAQRVAPGRARAWVEEARWLTSQGHKVEAIEKARAAVAAEPNHRDARALLDSLLANGAAPASTAEEDDKP
jgi:Vitamin K-dependent gamma-carboxylase